MKPRKGDLSRLFWVDPEIPRLPPLRRFFQGCFPSRRIHPPRRLGIISSVLTFLKFPEIFRLASTCLVFLHAANAAITRPFTHDELYILNRLHRVGRLPRNVQIAVETSANSLRLIRIRYRRRPVRRGRQERWRASYLYVNKAYSVGDVKILSCYLVDSTPCEGQLCIAYCQRRKVHDSELLNELLPLTPEILASIDGKPAVNILPPLLLTPKHMQNDPVKPPVTFRALLSQRYIFKSLLVQYVATNSVEGLEKIRLVLSRYGIYHLHIYGTPLVQLAWDCSNLHVVELLWREGGVPPVSDPQRRMGPFLRSPLHLCVENGALNLARIVIASMEGAIQRLALLSHRNDQLSQTRRRRESRSRRAAVRSRRDSHPARRSRRNSGRWEPDMRRPSIASVVDARDRRGLTPLMCCCFSTDDLGGLEEGLGLDSEATSDFSTPTTSHLAPESPFTSPQAKSRQRRVDDSVGFSPSASTSSLSSVDSFDGSLGSGSDDGSDSESDDSASGSSSGAMLLLHRRLRASGGNSPSPGPSPDQGRPASVPPVTTLRTPVSEMTRLALVRLLLRHRANVDLSTFATRDTALHLACRSAIGSPALLRVLLHEGRADISRPNQEGWTPLHVATRRGRADLVRCLVEDGGADPVRFGGDLRSTPLHLAAEGDHVETAETLLALTGVERVRFSGSGNVVASAASPSTHRKMLRRRRSSSTSGPVEPFALTDLLNRTPMDYATSMAMRGLFVDYGAFEETDGRPLGDASQGPQAMHLSVLRYREECVTLDMEDE